MLVHPSKKLASTRTLQHVDVVHMPLDCDRYHKIGSVDRFERTVDLGTNRCAIGSEGRMNAWHKCMLGSEGRNKNKMHKIHGRRKEKNKLQKASPQNNHNSNKQNKKPKKEK